MKIIDFHNHPDWHSFNYGKILSNMDENGISQTCLLNWECSENEYHAWTKSAHPGPLLGGHEGPIPFSLCLSYKEKNPDRFILGYCPDPRSPDACSKLRAAHGIYGAKVCGELKCRTCYDSPDVLRLFRTAGELRMPVVLHLQYDTQLSDKDTWNEWWGGGIHNFEMALKSCPDTIFLGHAQGFWIQISGDEDWKSRVLPLENSKVLPGGTLIRLLETYPNLYCDISANSGYSAFKRDPVFAKNFLVEYQDRIVFGRDYFDRRHFELIECLSLPQEVKEKVYFRNAEKILCL